MKKIFITALISMSLIATKTVAQYSQCSCNIPAQPFTAILNINGGHYMCMAVQNTETVPDINLPFGSTLFTGPITADCQSFCAGPPSPNGTPACTFARGATDLNLVNSTTGPTGTTYTSGFYSSTVTLSRALPIGISTITLYARCVANGPNPPVESRCLAGKFIINVLPPPPPFTVTMSNQCHTAIAPGQTLASNTGNIKFKVNFTSAPPAGTIVQITKNNAVLEQNNGPFTVNTDYFFENGTTGYGNGSYKIMLVYNNAEIFAANKPAGYSYTLTNRNLTCVALVPYDPRGNTINAIPR
jgi:hypothetical protein